MKKFLLFVAIAMTAIAANAQKADRSLSMKEQIKATSFTNGSMSVVLNDNAKKFGLKKASATTLELISAEPDAAGPEGDETEFTSTSTVEIYLPAEAVDGVYKAKTNLGNLDGCEWDVLVAEDMSTITIPVNQEYDDPTYGLIYMWGLIEKEDGIYYDDENDIVFNLNEDGMYECERVGWAMKMTGDYEKYTWTSSWYPTWMKPNGVETGSYAGSSWQEYSNPIFIEDLEDEINIYNFFEMTKLNILFDEESGNLLIPMGQPVATTSSNVDKDVYGYFINVVGTMLDGNSIYRDYEKEYTEAYFATIEEDEDGRYLARSTNNILTDPNEGYISLASNPDSDGAAYGMGWLHGINFTLNNGSYKIFGETAIKNVNNVKNNNKIYNLAGQEVSASTKGIVIVNGKKVIK